MKKPPLFRTWLEIDAKAIEKNARTLKSLLSNEVAMMAVVKSNAYGHGMIMSAKAAIKGGADWLGVDEVGEALELRKSGFKNPVLVLGYTPPDYFKAAAQKNISLTISSLDSLHALSKIKLPKKLNIHLKFDTGLHRQGILETHVQQAIRIISANNFPAVLEGAYTHFAVMEDPLRADYSKGQAKNFQSIIDRLNGKGFTPITHASASSGILFSKDYHFDMSRAGIALYGLWPSREIKNWSKGTEIIPALTWKAIISEVKLVNKGAKIGYDLTHELKKNSRIAIIPVGYWHGLPRALSNRGHVLVGGKKANIIGRVSMDMAIIDISDIPNAKPGDEVVILGKQGKSEITAEEMAELSGTINYEVVTRINPLLPRILPLL
jgi:alanine racemase